MKNFYTSVFILLLPVLMFSQMDNKVKLKQINIVKTNFRDSKSGELTNKTVLFKEGKLQSIQTSDVIQKFFYNTHGLLDMTVKDKVGSNWKEVVNYVYDDESRLIKFVKKYQEEGQFVIKKVDISYDGPRVKAITTKSSDHQDSVENIEYIVENGIIVRRSSRDRNQQIIKKTEYVYAKDNIVAHKGLVGDKSMQTYVFDDKNSADLLIVQNLFGPNYKVIVPLISFHEDEFDFESISNNNLLTYSSNSPRDIGKTGKFKYNNMNYPSSHSLIEENGIVKTEMTYMYEFDNTNFGTK
jgi:hypothetical protein